MGEPQQEDEPAYSIGDSVWFRPDFNGYWYRGTVEDVGRWFLWVRKLGETHLYKVPLTDKRVRHMESTRADEMRHAIARIEGARTVLKGCDPIEPGTPLRVVRVLAARVGAPLWKPRKPYRSRRYREHVRGHECINVAICRYAGRCQIHHTSKDAFGQQGDDYDGVSACPGCHRVVTDTGHYPGRSLEETQSMNRAAIRELNMEYMAGLDGIRRAA